MGNTFYYKSGSLAFGLKEEQAEIFFENLKIKSNLRPTINGTGILLSGEGLPKNIMFTTGNQTISGIKAFISRPTVNGTGVLLSGEATKLPETIVYTTGNQTISGNKNFIQNVIVGDQTQEDLFVVSGNSIQFGIRPTINGTGVLLSGEAAQLPSTIVYTTGLQNVSGSKTFLNTTIFKQDIILSGAAPISNPNVSLGVEISNGIYFDNFYKSPYIKYYAGYDNTLEIRNPGGSPGMLKLINGQKPEGNGPEYGQKIILDGDAAEISYEASNHYFNGGPVWAETIIPQNIIAGRGGYFMLPDPTAIIKITGKLEINDSLNVSSLEGRVNISGNMALELNAGSNKILIEKEDGGAIKIQSPDISFSTKPTVNGTGVLLSGELNLSSYITTGQTGSFYPTSNPSGYITGVNLSSYITTSQTGNFYPKSNPSGYITGVNLSSYVTTSQTGNFLSIGQNSFIITLHNTNDTQAAGHNYFGNIAAGFNSAAGGVNRRFPVLESCVVKKASWTQYNQTIGSPSLNSTGYFINTTTNTTGTISTIINTQSTSSVTNYIAEFSPPIIISNGDYIVCSLFGPTYATTYPASVRNTVNLYCYN